MSHPGHVLNTNLQRRRDSKMEGIRIEAMSGCDKLLAPLFGGLLERVRQAAAAHR